jgi:hypothetical protein
VSYARFGGDSDVYVYTATGGIECCFCSLIPRHWVDDPKSVIGGFLKPEDPNAIDTFPSNVAMIEHLERHRAAGHMVPEDVFERLRDPKDVAENEAIWAKP